MYVLIGFLSGILGGMGMGGGTALIPLLRLMGVDQKSAQGLNLIAFVPMAAVAVWLHHRSGRICWKSVLQFVLPATLFAVIGCLIARQLPAAILSRAFGAFLLLLAAGSLISVRRDLRNLRGKD